MFSGGSNPGIMALRVLTWQWWMPCCARLEKGSEGCLISWPRLLIVLSIVHCEEQIGELTHAASEARWQVKWTQRQMNAKSWQAHWSWMGVMLYCAMIQRLVTNLQKFLQKRSGRIPYSRAQHREYIQVMYSVTLYHELAWRLGSWGATSNEPGRYILQAATAQPWASQVATSLKIVQS